MALGSFSPRTIRCLRIGGAGLALLSALGLWQQATAAEPPHPGAQREHDTPPRAAALALRFEPNHGQFPEPVRYLARGKGYALYLTPGGATFSLQRQAPEHDVTRESGLVAPLEKHELAMRVVGGADVEPRGDALLPGTNNYFVGSDPSLWRTDVETYARVIYPQVRPGVDVIYYGTAGSELEYDFVLAPGVEAALAEMEFSGLESIELTREGTALLRLPGGGVLQQRAPLAYQVRDGSRSRVGARYVLRAPNRLGFEVGAYDRTRPLVIDPELAYSTYFGAQHYDQFNAVAHDAAGNTYAVGYTTGGLFPTFPISNPLQPTYGGGSQDAVIVKLNAAGTGLVYSTYLGGNNADQAYSVAVDATNNTYVTGVTYSTNFPVANAYQATHRGSSDAFVAKINANGSSLLYSTYLGGTSSDNANAITVSSTGDVYVVGQTFSFGFPVTSGVLQGTNAGGSGDAFVTRFTPSGSGLVFSTFLGGVGSDFGNCVTLAGNGELLVAGDTSSLNFPTVSPYQSVFQGAPFDGFVSRINATGTALLTSTYLGGNDRDSILGLVEHNGSPLVVGPTHSLNFPTASAVQAAHASPGSSDAFVTHLTSNGSALRFSTFLGGAGSDVARAAASDGGHVYVIGDTESTNFPVLVPFPGQGSFRGGSSDAFLVAYSSNNLLSYSSYLGGNANDYGTGISVRFGQELHLVGNTLSSNFPVVFPLESHDVNRGGQDGFIARSAAIVTSARVPALGVPALALLAGLLLGFSLFLFPWRGRAA